MCLDAKMTWRCIRVDYVLLESCGLYDTKSSQEIAYDVFILLFLRASLDTDY